jgi:hypothetical protein
MKKKNIFVLMAGIILVALLFFTLWFPLAKNLPANPPPGMVDYRSVEAQRARTNLKVWRENMRSNASTARRPNMVSGFVPMPTDHYVETIETNEPVGAAPVIDLKFSNPTNWPDDPRLQVTNFYQFAKIAKLYKFDPVVTDYSDSRRYQKAVGTATHWADIDTRDGRVEKMSSYRDRSGSMNEYPGVTEEWANATGNWHERQMVEETFRILRELGYTNTLQAVSHGRHEFKPQGWRVKLPEGGFKIVYPFATVKLFGPNVSGDPNEPPRVTAQFRMGPNGPVGLVDWFSLY